MFKSVRAIQKADHARTRRNGRARKAISADAQAWSKAFDRHCGIVYRYVKGQVRDIETAEELTNAVFLDAVDDVKGDRLGSPPSVARLIEISRTLLTHYFGPGGPSVEEQFDFRFAAEELSSSDAAKATVRRDQLRVALGRLDKEQRQVAILRFIVGLTCQDVAYLLNEPEKDVIALQRGALTSLADFHSEREFDDASELDTILQRCLQEIEKDRSQLEACVRRYPKLSEQLTRLLETALIFQNIETPHPGIEAMEAGRDRLIEAAEKRWTEEAPPRRLLGLELKPGLLPWMIGAAAIATLLAVLTTMSFLSQDSLPGQPLYPVKRGIESARYILASSSVGKANLRITLAERRAEELGIVVASGDSEKIEGLAQSIANNLGEAQRLVATLQDPDKIREFQTKLEHSASEQLSLMETSLAKAPPEARNAVSDAFSTTSDSYGRTVEAVALKAPPPLTVGLGFLQILASDPPPPPLDNVFIEVDQLEVYLSAGPDKGWINVVDRPNAFDLLIIDQIHSFLGRQQIPAGTYTQIRFGIVRAVVVADGQAHIADLPGGKLSFHRPFVVNEGETTAVTIDFDGQRSVTVTEDGRFKLEPNIRLLVDEPRQEGEEGDPGDDSEPPRQVTVEGTIEDITGSVWVVNGQSISVPPDVKVMGDPEVGRLAEVLAVMETDGSLTAAEIKVSAKSKDGLGDTMFEGIIEAISDTQWQIASRTVNITPETEVLGEGVVGWVANVKVQIDRDGAFDALLIEVIEPISGNTQEVEIEGIIASMIGEIWEVGMYSVNITSETEISGTPRIGLAVKIIGQLQPDGSVIAGEIFAREDKEIDQGTTEITAVIEVMGSGTWRVGGRVINITSETGIIGEPRVGYVAKVVGVALSDGSMTALTVRIQSDSSTLARLEGPLEVVQEPIWRVGGRSVKITPDTEVDGPPRLGRTAQVKGHLKTDGSLHAVEIDMLGMNTYGLPAMEFEGPIQTIGEDSWVVGDQTIVIAPLANVRGRPQVGLMARVSGIVQPDGTFVALGIHIGTEQAELHGLLEEMGDATWQVAGRSVSITPDTYIHGEPRVGRAVSVKGKLQSDGSLEAIFVQMTGRDYRLPELEFEGVIRDINDDSWTVRDQEIILASQTQVVGEPQVGSTVRVKAVLQPDDTVVALILVVQESDDTP
jgi:DNA-directed RNA polymerase specialized sigma24 family protein